MHKGSKPRTKEQYLNDRLKRKYGISLADYDERVAEVKGVCEICGGTDFGKYGRLCVDHDHETGAIRGLLCQHCNTVLGAAKDNPEILMKAILYLENQNEKASFQISHYLGQHANVGRWSRRLPRWQ